MSVTDISMGMTPQKKSRQPVFTIVVVAGMFLAFFSLSFLEAILEAKNLAKALSSAHWPMVQGKVLSSGSGWTGTGRGRHLWMRISYAYAAEGGSWVGSNITIGNKMEPYAIQAVPQTYPVGSAVEVRYQPGNPADSVLEAGVNATHVMSRAFTLNM